MGISDRLIDKRVLERNVQKGLVDRKEFDKHLEQLPDRADAAETLADAEDDDDSE